MQKPEPVQENETDKIILNLQIHTDHRILDNDQYENESHWVPPSYGLVPHLSKKLSKFPSCFV